MEWLDPTLIDALRLGLLGRLLLATALGGLIGLERELSGKPAGLRTNILICVGATLLMEISQAIAAAAELPPADPGRIAAQVVSGIGFIGAGTILVERGSIVGLTTAATLWVVAAIGLAVGAHAYVEAVGTAVLVALTLVLLGWIEDFLFRRRTAVVLEVVTEPRADLLDAIVRQMEEQGLRPRTEKVEKQAERYRVSFELRGSARGRDSALRELAATPGVRKITVR